MEMEDIKDKMRQLLQNSVSTGQQLQEMKVSRVNDVNGGTPKSSIEK